MEGNAKRRFFLDLCIAFVCVLFDQFTKHLAVVHLKDQEPIVLIPRVLELRYLENRGAAFGVLQNQKIFFIIMTCIILALVVYALWKLPDVSRFKALHIMGGFLMAGAIGNFLDRIRLDYVVDFIYISLIDFPIFNVADMYVSFTCVIGLVLLFWGPYKEEDFSFLKIKR